MKSRGDVGELDEGEMEHVLEGKHDGLCSSIFNGSFKEKEWEHGSNSSSRSPWYQFQRKEIT